MDSFSNLDYAIGALYFVLVPLVGILVGRRERDLGEYFLGGRRIPWWAVWLSILAAEVSAATFVGAPAFAYKNDWTYVQPVFGTIIARIVVAYLFLKPFYDLNVTTVYGYLEKRFGRRTRDGAATIFLVTRLLASGVRLYGGALVLHAVLGDALSVEGGIALLAGVTLVYTLVGGIKAVVATDAIQVVVMFGGAFAAAFAILHALPHGFADVQAAVPAEKLKVIDTGFSLKGGDTPTLWGGAIGMAFLTMGTHGTDQDIVQRLLTAKDVSSSRRALIASGILDIPIVCIFLAIGSLLFAWVKVVAPEGVPGKPDEVFPWFIAHHLPHGISGLVVAGVLSVAMGSLSAAMNALASTVVFDFWKPYVRPEASPQEDVVVARGATFVCALLLTIVALVVSSIAAANPKTLLLVIAFKVVGYTYGALLGTFLRGFLTKDGGDVVNLVAMAASIGTVVAVGYFFEVEWTWFVFMGTVVTFGVGLLGARGVPLLYGPGSHGDAGAAKT